MTEIRCLSSAPPGQRPVPKPWHIESAFSVDGIWCVIAADGTVQSVHATLQAARRHCEPANLVGCETCPHSQLCRP